MFWDKVAVFYDLFENTYNGKVNRELCAYVASLVGREDVVLECACGTGMITCAIAVNCKSVVATDFSNKMLEKAGKKCASYPNARFEWANMEVLSYAPDTFDVVIAGNVLHLLEHPDRAITELKRVCRPGGRIILPTYVNKKKNGEENFAARVLQKFGAGFKRQFDCDRYRAFLIENGCPDPEIRLIQGHMPCAVAVFANDK